MVEGSQGTPSRCSGRGRGGWGDDLNSFLLLSVLGQQVRCSAEAREVDVRHPLRPIPHAPVCGHEGEVMRVEVMRGELMRGGVLSGDAG